MSNRKPLTESQQLIARRRVARRLALIGVYQWLITRNEFQEIYAGFQQDVELAKDFRKADAAFFHHLLRGSIEQDEAIIALLEPYLDRKLSQVDPIEHAALRIASYELLHHPETPYKVVVNEAVNLAKKFGGEQGHRYVNGVLDKVALQTRPLEIAAAQDTPAS
ncbi:MAG: transcription antitermination factor NusB [Thiolinea sp.]